MLVVMDGWGLRAAPDHNAVRMAETPVYNAMVKEYPYTTLVTCGTDVGLPKGLMGNSEVGHLNLGAGRIVWQDLMEVAQAVADGSFDTNPAVVMAIEHAKKNNSRLHLFGLISGARVHSLDEAYFAFVRLCAKHELRKDRLVFHIFTDGRDTGPKTGAGWVDELQRKLDLYDTGVIASVAGRYYGMDRDKRWERVEKAWKAMVDGVGEHTASSVCFCPSGLTSVTLNSSARRSSSETMASRSPPFRTVTPPSVSTTAATARANCANACSTPISPASRANTCRACCCVR